MPAKILAFLFVTAAAFAAPNVPASDARNTMTPGTNTHFHFEAPTSLEAWQQRRAYLRTQILAAAGLLPLPQKQPCIRKSSAELTARVHDRESLARHAARLLFGRGSIRGRRRRAHPGILLAHGHWTYGRLEAQQLCNPQALAGTLAKAGFVVFMYDMVGYNDTMQTPHKFGGDSEQLWSFGPLGLQLWNSIRALDFSPPCRKSIRRMSA